MQNTKQLKIVLLTTFNSRTRHWTYAKNGPLPCGRIAYYLVAHYNILSYTTTGTYLNTFLAF